MICKSLYGDLELKELDDGRLMYEATFIARTTMNDEIDGQNNNLCDLPSLNHMLENGPSPFDSSSMQQAEKLDSFLSIKDRLSVKGTNTSDQQKQGN